LPSGYVATPFFLRGTQDCSVIAAAWKLADAPCPITPFIRSGRLWMGSGYLSGQSDANDPSLYFSFSSEGAPRLDRALPGICAIASVDLEAGECCAATSQPMIEAIYYGERGERWALSNRPLLAQLALSDENRPRFDNDYIADVLPAGYSIGERTALANVRRLRVSAMLRMSSRGAEVIPMPRFVEAQVGELPLEARVEAIVDSLRAAARPLHALPPPEFLLSAGKDSRLVAALLSSEGIVPAAAVTLNPPEAWESPIASRVAQACGFPHRFIQPVFDQEHDLAKSVCATLRSTSGAPIGAALHYAYSIPAIDEGFRPLVMGHGELQKGGWAKSMVRRREDIDARCTVLTSSKFVTPGINQRANTYLNDWAKALNVPSTVERLYWLNHDFRLTSWLGPHYLSVTSRTLPVYPLLDGRYVSVCSGLSMLDRVSEQVAFLAMKRLKRELSYLPVFAGRWRFEATQARPEITDGYEAREPLAPVSAKHGGGHAEIWLTEARLGVIKDLVFRSAVTPLLREGTNPEIWSELQSLTPAGIGKLEERKSKLDFLWRLFGLSVLYAAEWW
jgi:hypothetical protein